MTRLFLMRHSQAAPADFRPPDDARWLTARGRELAREAGQALVERGGIDCIVTSPLVRAVQTAEIVAGCLAWQGEIHSLCALRSEGLAQRAVEELQALGAGSVLALTHEPLVSTMSALLAGREVGGGFRTAEIRCFRDNALDWRWRA
jgi:phosphohistidine phosphatase